MWHDNIDYFMFSKSIPGPDFRAKGMVWWGREKRIMAFRRFLAQCQL
ncbi:hypothetical protein Mpsy_1754 [Methanolobus psychrophilus R15]|nr:hypothetical protein Mpsy_1754 [Methanolobus psychrophilus R15]